MAEVTAFRNNALPYPVYGVPWTIVFPILDEDGDPVTGLTCDSEVSLNGDTGVDCTNEGTEIPYTTATNKGMYYLTLTAAEMTADIVAVTVYTGATTSQATCIVLYPRKLVEIRSATAAGGAAGYITLDGSASAVDDAYNGMLCVATIDTNVEARIISNYTGSNNQAAVTPSWNVTPDNDDTFKLYLPEGIQFNQANVTHVNSTAQTARDLGLALPAVAPSANGGLPTVNANNRVQAMVMRWLTDDAAGTPSALSTGNLPADVKLWLAAAPAAVTASGYLQTVLLRWLTDNAAGTPLALTGANLVQADAIKLNGAVPNNAAAAPAMITSQEVRDAMKLAATVGAPAADSVDAHLDTVITDTTTIQARIGAFTGAGVNTILGFLRAMANKAAGVATPTDLSALGTYDNTTDSTEAIRDRGDAAWTTGGASLTAQEVRDAMKLAPTAGAPVADSVDAHLDTIVSNETTILARIGAFTGAGLNTILGFLRAMMRKDAALTPSDVGGTFDNTTDSEEAISEVVATLAPGGAVNLNAEITEIHVT